MNDEKMIADYINKANSKLYDEIYNRGYRDCFNENNDYRIDSIAEKIMVKIEGFLFDDASNVRRDCKNRVKEVLEKQLKGEE